MLNGLLALYGRVEPIAEFGRYCFWLAKQHDVWAMKKFGVVGFWTKLYVINIGVTV